MAGAGTAFALWRDKEAGATSWEIQAAVRPAGSDTWGVPQALVTDRDESAGAVLAVTADGRAVVTWLTGSGADGSLAARSTTWDPATAGWSEPGTLASYDGLDMSTPRLAAAADGTVTAVWDQGDGRRTCEVMTATLAPGTAAWSTPQRLGSFADGTIWGLQLAVAPDGAATTVWAAHDRFADDHIVSTVTRPSATGDWSSPAVLPGTTGTSSDVQVSMNAHDATTVLWHDGNTTTAVVATTATGADSPVSADWCTVRPWAPGTTRNHRGRS